MTRGELSPADSRPALAIHWGWWVALALEFLSLWGLALRSGVLYALAARQATIGEGLDRLAEQLHSVHERRMRLLAPLLPEFFRGYLTAERFEQERSQADPMFQIEWLGGTAPSELSAALTERILAVSWAEGGRWGRPAIVALPSGDATNSYFVVRNGTGQALVVSQDEQHLRGVWLPARIAALGFGDAVSVEFLPTRPDGVRLRPPLPPGLSPGPPPELRPGRPAGVRPGMAQLGGSGGRHPTEEVLMRKRILVVEDEPSLALGLEQILSARNYDVVMADRGDRAVEFALSASFDLILLDIMLPVMSGFEVLKKLQAAGNDVPVILLTARGGESDKVLGFELGADDYVTKPFSPMELLGRIGAVLRRTGPAQAQAAEADFLQFGPVTLDLRAYAAMRDGDPVDLPAKAFEILKVLARTPGEAVHRDKIIDAVWGADEYINERTLTNLAVRIRQVIEGDARQPRHLKTVHGVGYRLDLQ